MTDIKQVTYCISGVTLTGNKGGTSMLYATLQELGGEGVHFDLLSIYPEQDEVDNTISELSIIPVPPLLLICFYLPLSLLLWPLVYFSFGRTLLCRFPLYRSLLAADAVVDLSGIAFVDGRGLPLIVYNVACTLPALLFGKKVCKLSQAMGPFRSALNRFCAGTILRRCKLVIGRGAKTGEHLQDLGLTESRVLPDTAFAMRIEASHQRQADEILRTVAQPAPMVVISPSQVVNGYCLSEEIDYAREMSLFCDRLVGHGYSVLLLPHSTVQSNSKNNDLEICRLILQQVQPSPRVTAVLDDLDPRVLRAIIGRADFFLGSRFHSMISALAMEVPLLVIGWSHKYREVLEMFGLEDLGIDWRDLASDSLAEQFDALVARSGEVKISIERHLATVIEGSKENFTLVREQVRAE